MVLIEDVLTLNHYLLMISSADIVGSHVMNAVVSFNHDLLMFSSADIVGSPDMNTSSQGCDIGGIQDSESEGARQTLGPSHRFCKFP